MNTRTSKIDGFLKWEVNKLLDKESNKIPGDNGYFGRYTKITYDGKQSIVYCDDRDAIVHVKTNWYDFIFYGSECGNSWDGDYRWNHDKPLVAMDGTRYTLLNPHDGKELVKDWSGVIVPKWKYNQTIRDYLEGVSAKDGRTVYITPKGTILDASLSDENNIQTIMKSVKALSNDEIQKQWIDKGQPCYFIRGLEYKGAAPSKVSQGEATELFKNHNCFNGSFNSAEWRVIDGLVSLLFREYADSDYD